MKTFDYFHIFTLLSRLKYLPNANFQHEFLDDGLRGVASRMLTDQD